MSKIKTVGIIGGGVSGLTAGGLLSREGLNVRLFEANDKLGGCCANTELGGYTFNDGAMFLILPRILDYIFKRLGLDRPSLLPLRKIKAPFSTTLPDGTIVLFDDNKGVTIEKSNGTLNIIKLQKEIESMLKNWEPVLNLFADDIFLHPFSFWRFLVKGWRHLHMIRGTVASELNKLFSDEAVRAAMSAALFYIGVPPHKTPVLSLLGLVAIQSEGMYLPEGGMGKIPEAMSLSLENNGGEIHLNSKTDKIVLKNGRVYGLEVEGQDLVELDAVISTVSGMKTFGSLLNPEDVPKDMKRKVQSAPLSSKALVIQLGLSNKVDVHSHINNICPLMEEQYEVFMPDENEVKWLVYYVPTVSMPELAPPGGSIIELFPAIKQDVPANDWDEQKKEKIVESALSAFSSRYDIDIAVKRVISPKDYQDSMHLYKGAVYGLSPASYPRALFPHNPRIRGLYQAGQTTYPGYGVGAAAMSGIFAAEALLKTEGI